MFAQTSENKYVLVRLNITTETCSKQLILLTWGCFKRNILHSYVSLSVFMVKVFVCFTVLIVGSDIYLEIL
jgi:uncharacterized protein YhhL (DUF1145 family)